MLPAENCVSAVQDRENEGRCGWPVPAEALRESPSILARAGVIGASRAGSQPATRPWGLRLTRLSR